MYYCGCWQAFRAFRGHSSLTSQRREEDHVANARAVGQQHHQAVYANAAAARRWHAVFQRADEVVVVEHGFVVAFVLGCDLAVEAGRLLLGIVELAEAVAELAAGDVELEALGHARVGVAGARQWRNFDRVFADEGGLPELFFYRFFKVHHLQAG